MPKDNIRVMLVDDHQVLRDGLRLLLESEGDMQVVGEAASGAEALDLAKAVLPDVAVVDLGLPDMSGMEVTRRLGEKLPDVRVVVLSMHTSKEFIVGAIEAGAEAYVPKSTTHESLIEAIRTVYAGERYLHPLGASALMETYTETETSEEVLFQELTEREQEVFRLSAMGFTSREIGEQLIISPKTVDTYRHRAFEKMGIEHRSELVSLALRLGILKE